jgi:hypothetical protein
VPEGDEFGDGDPRRAVRAADRADDAHPVPGTRRGCVPGDEELDGGRCVLDDRSASRSVEQRARDGDDSLNRNAPASQADRRGDRRDGRIRLDRARARWRGRRRRRARRGTRRPGQVARVAQPEPIAIERTAGGCSLPDDPDEAQPIAALRNSRLESARTGCAGDKRRTRSVAQAEHEVAARLADDGRVQRRVEGDEARLHELAQRSGPDRQRERDRSGTDEPDTGDSRPDLELAIRVEQGADDLDECAAGGHYTVGEPDEDRAGLVGDDPERWKPRAPGLGGDDASNHHGRADGRTARGSDGCDDRGRRG